MLKMLKMRLFYRIKDGIPFFPRLCLISSHIIGFKKPCSQEYWCVFLSQDNSPSYVICFHLNPRQNQQAGRTEKNRVFLVCMSTSLPAWLTFCAAWGLLSPSCSLRGDGILRFKRETDWALTADTKQHLQYSGRVRFHIHCLSAGPGGRRAEPQQQD